jgi:predicted  nucleic acid-binding Zn-ribbon protein
MAIASVIQGTIEVEGKVLEFDSFKVSTWLETVTSFRFEPTGANKPYTVRKESRPGGVYWYGYRKVAGKLHKKYIGRTPELNTAKLEEIGEALNIPPQPRVTDKVTHRVTHEIADSSLVDRLTALELQMQGVQESLEALRGIVLGKSESFASPDEPPQLEPVTEVTDNKLLIELSNLKAENETLRRRLVESRDTIETLNWGTDALKEQLEALRAENEALQKETSEVRTKSQYWKNAYEVIDEGNKALMEELEEARAENKRWEEAFSELEGEKDDLEQVLVETKQQYSNLLPNLNQELASVREQLETCKQQQLATEFELPEASDLLNRLKAKRKKAAASLADMEAILEILEELTPMGGN